MTLVKSLHGTMAAYIYYCTVRYSIMARIKLGEANKSANRWGNLRAKGGVVVTNLCLYLGLLVCGSNTFLLHDLADNFYSQQYQYCLFTSNLFYYLRFELK